MKVKGYRLLVKPDEIETTTEGGIVVVMDEDKAKIAQMYGKVVQVGSECWHDFKDKQWCKEGDRVAWSKFAGKFITDPETAEEYVILNDEDVLVVFGE